MSAPALARHSIRGRNSQLVRQISVLKLILSGRRNLHEMAQELHVHPRTIRRDIDALEEVHLPIVWEHDWLDQHASPRVSLSLEQCPVCLKQVKRSPISLEARDDR